MKKILIVEDKEINIRLYNYILLKIDAEIKITKNGLDALKIVEEFRPNIIILDIQIPGINGIEVAKRLRDNPEYSDIIIVAVTAYSMKGDEEKILAAGCDHYVSKPIDTRSFPGLIKLLFLSQDQKLFA